MPPDPEYVAPEEPYAEVWARVYLSPHGSCGGWTADSRDGTLRCACGQVLGAAGRAA